MSNERDCREKVSNQIACRENMSNQRDCRERVCPIGEIVESVQSKRL